MLRSFIFTGDSHVGVAVGLDINTKIDGTAANLAILYVVLLRNRGIYQYVDALAAIGTFNVPFTELSHSHLAPVTVGSWGVAKASRTNPKPAGDNHGAKNRITNREHPRRGLVIQNSVQPMRYERTGVHCGTHAFPERHFPGCKRANDSDPRLQHNNPDCSQVRDSKPWVSYPCPIKEFPDENRCQAKDDKRNERDVTEKKNVGGEQKQEVGLHLCHPSSKPNNIQYLARALRLQDERRRRLLDPVQCGVCAIAGNQA